MNLSHAVRCRNSQPIGGSESKGIKVTNTATTPVNQVRVVLVFDYLTVAAVQLFRLQQSSELLLGVES
jgi:hypothetical protein